MARTWSELSARTKRRYRSQGIHPNTYNSWNRLSRAQRTELNQRAQDYGQEGANPGLRRRASLALARRLTGHRMTRSQAPAVALALVREGGSREQIGRLFNLPAGDHWAWTQFLSP